MSESHLPTHKQLREILDHWVPGERFEWLPVAGGLSETLLWRVQSTQNQQAPRYALRRWPATGGTTRLKRQHQHQSKLHAQLRTPIACPQRSRAGATLVASGQHVWELTDWLEGEAVNPTDVSLLHVRSAVVGLAEFHQVATRFEQQEARIALSPRLNERRNILRRYSARRGPDELNRLGPPLDVNLQRADLQRADLQRADWHSTAQQCQATLQQQLPGMLAMLDSLVGIPLPLQWIHGDARREHFLFEKRSFDLLAARDHAAPSADCPTRLAGIIDFGAMCVDSPVGDLSRLLMGIAGGSVDAWKHGLDAYQEVRPLTPAERQTLPGFALGGTLAAVVRWLEWEAAASCESQRQIACDRLETLHARLAGPLSGESFWGQLQ